MQFKFWFEDRSVGDAPSMSSSDVIAKMRTLAKEAADLISQSDPWKPVPRKYYTLRRQAAMLKDSLWDLDREAWSLAVKILMDWFPQ